MMGLPQQINLQPRPNQMTGTLPPRGTGTTTVDISEGYAPAWIVLTRTSWERVLLVGMRIDGQACPVYQTQDGEYLMHAIPQPTAEDLTRSRRLELVWQNRSKSGSQFSYEVTAERPAQPVLTVSPTSPITQNYPARLLSPPPSPLGVGSPAPMSPPVVAMPPVGVPMLGQPAPYAAPVVAPAAPPAAVGRVPMVGRPPMPPGVTATLAAASVASAPPPEAGTEHEQHVGAVYGVPPIDVRNIAESLGASAGFSGEDVLRVYVENFGSSGLDLVPRDWIDHAKKQAASIGVDPRQLLVSTVLHSLLGRMVEDRDLAELRKGGASGNGPLPDDFVVKSTTPADDRPPETARTGAAAVATRRATGAQVKAMAETLSVDPGWLLLRIKIVAEARGQSPDRIVELGTASTLHLLREHYTDESTAEIDATLAAAEAAKTAAATTESEAGEAGEAFPVEPLSLEAEAENRAALIRQRIATRAIDWLSSEAQGGSL